MNWRLQSLTVEKDACSKLYQFHLSPEPVVTTNTYTHSHFRSYFNKIRYLSLFHSLTHTHTFSSLPLSLLIFHIDFLCCFPFSVFRSKVSNATQLMNLELNFFFYLLVCCLNFLKNEKISSQQLLIKSTKIRRRKEIKRKKSQNVVAAAAAVWISFYLFHSRALIFCSFLRIRNLNRRAQNGFWEIDSQNSQIKRGSDLEKMRRRLRRSNFK